jgi:hypothetical protein
MGFFSGRRREGRNLLLTSISLLLTALLRVRITLGEFQQVGKDNSQRLARRLFAHPTRRERRPASFTPPNRLSEEIAMLLAARQF